MSGQLRASIRNYLYPMTITEMEIELELSVEMQDELRTKYIEEYIAEETNRRLASLVMERMLKKNS